MKLFDSRVFIGRDITMSPFQPEADYDLISVMLEKYSVAKALVTSFHSIRLDFFSGNELTFNLAKRDSRLIPCPTVLPAISENKPAETFIETLIARGSRCVTYLPKEAGVIHAKLAYGELLSALEKYNIPVIIPALELEPEKLIDILQEYSGLKIIYSGASYRIGRNIFHMMKNFPNLILDIASPFFINQGIEDIVDFVGPKQLVYASKFPLVEPGASIFYLACAQIKEKEKHMIAFENMNRLTGEVVA